MEIGRIMMIWVEVDMYVVKVLVLKEGTGRG
jgi:hypothetical protein